MISLIALCFTFNKAHRNVILAIIPIVNYFVFYSIVRGNALKGLIILIPIFGAIYHIITTFKFGKSFGKSDVFSILCIFFFPICLWIIGFGQAKYVGAK